MKKILLFTFIWLNICVSVWSVPNAIVEHYTVDQGLPNNIVNCTVKGKDGFIWFGTWYGLCSFDGVKVKTYNNKGESNSDIPPKKIQRIVEDKNGYLWIKTVDRKLYVFDKVRETFHAVYDDMKDYLENIQVIKVQKTEDGRILLLTKDKSLLLACTDIHGKIGIQLLHDSRQDVNVYDMRLKHDLFCETQQHLSWIGMDYKILFYDKGKELKEKPADFITKKILTADKDAFTCAFNADHLLWLGNKYGEIYCINPQTGMVNKYVLPGITSPIRNILVTKAGNVYLSTDGQGIYEYNLGYKSLNKLSLGIEKGGITHSFVDRYDKVWFVIGEKSLIYYDPLNKSKRNYSFPREGNICDFNVQDAGEQGVFFLTPSGEILVFDRDSFEMHRLNQMKPFSNDFPNQLFLNQLLDEDGVLWLASTTLGVYRMNFPKKQFRLLDLRTFSASRAISDDLMGIRALFQASNGDIWVGTRWQELYRLDSNGHLKQVFSLGNVYHIMEDNKGNLWLSTKGNGLIKAEFDINSPHGVRFISYKSDTNNPSSISSNDVYCTFQDSKGRIWVGLLGGGLNLLREEADGVTFIHKHNGLRKYPPYGLYMEVRNMLEDNEGRIWVGTMDGLMSFDSNFDNPEQIEFETYRKDSASSNVADNDIYVLFKDATDQIWVGVFGGGVNRLVKYDKETHSPIFKSYGIRDGLNNDVVMSIVEDNDQNLWFATESGLSRFDRQTEHFRNFDKYDGFLSVQMEEGSALKIENGELWVGCKEGILIFSPNKMETFSCNNRTYIVDFKVSNEDIRDLKNNPLMKSVKYADSITLNYDQSMFTIEFAALNFINQNRISYKYMLEGYEKEWHYNGRNRIASYTNVRPGKYVFRVRTVDEANPEQIYETTLAIRILPPWWLSWWAYCIYAVLGITLLIVVIRVSYLMIRMKNDVYIEQKLSELKIKFFTNISHELRTPLTLIKGPIQELKEKENLTPKGIQYVDLMEKNTNRMLNLVNQILDFRKIQNGKMRLHVSQINLNEMLESFQKEFRILSEENEIAYSFSVSDEPILVWGDKEKLEIVLRNVISNAFKFTPSGGSIFISAGVSEGEHSCFIRVEDTGIGIPQNKLTEIFERFSQGGNAHTSYYQGTGIGLALSKEIIALHHGTIKAENLQPSGAAFIIQLLLGKKHYKELEVDFYLGGTDSGDEVEGADIPSISEENIEKEPVDNSLPSLLLVEDNKDLGNLIKLQLEDKYNVYLAHNGVEGLKKVHLYHPDIVVTDQMMPEMDGMEMLTCIRKDFQISHIPVIMLTAKSSDEAKTKAISLGANAYITKPFSKEYLSARIEQLLNDRQMFQERLWKQMNDTATEAEESGYEQYLVKKDVQFLEKIHQIIEENLDNSDFNIDAIATTIGLSRSAFFKKLKSLIGLAPVDLVKEIRLNKSVELIKNTNMSISEIAFAVGFKDSGYYSKCFRKKYNQTPREYINEVRKSATG